MRHETRVGDGGQTARSGFAGGARGRPVLFARVSSVRARLAHPSQGPEPPPLTWMEPQSRSHRPCRKGGRRGASATGRLIRRVPLAGYDFMKYFLTPTCALAGSRGDRDEHWQSRLLRVRGLVAKIEHRSMMTIRCREDYKRGDRSYEDLGSGTTRCWEERDDCSEEVTTSKRKHTAGTAGRGRWKHTLFPGIFPTAVSFIMFKGTIH